MINSNEFHWQLLPACVSTQLTKTPVDGLVDYEIDKSYEETWDSIFEDKIHFPVTWLEY